MVAPPVGALAEPRRGRTRDCLTWAWFEASMLGTSGMKLGARPSTTRSADLTLSVLVGDDGW
jgi:hypothetical protein